MSFELCNAPSSFQATINMIFHPFLRQFIIIFFDDILIYSGSLADHRRHLEATFQVLLDNQFVLKLSKCSFAQPQVEYLDHLISHKGLDLVASKVAAIHKWPVPRLTKAVRSFLGLVRFYCWFIKGYATITVLFVKTSRMDPFQWTALAQIAFEHLKQAFLTAPVLALPDFQLPFTVEIDASGVGMEVVLSQQRHCFFQQTIQS